MKAVLNLIVTFDLALINKLMFRMRILVSKINSMHIVLIIITGLSFIFINCGAHPVFIPNRESIESPEGVILEERLSRHWSRRPERLYYVYRDSLDNYIQHGPDTWFYLDGTVKFRESYLFGKKHGISEFWFSNGHKQGEIHYDQGKMNGKAISWHKNGQKHIEKMWIKGMLTGKEIRWDKKGIKRMEILWADNKIITKLFWDKKGNSVK